MRKVFFIAWTLAVIFVLVWIGYNGLKKSPEPVVLPIPTLTFEPLLTKWVYDHSNRISYETAKLTAQESIKTGKPLLMLALMEVESNFVPTAVSNKGAIGLTQIMYGVHEKAILKSGIATNKRDLFNVGPSIQAGHLILNDYLKQSNGKIKGALELYLGGRDGHYLQKILLNLAELYLITANHKEVADATPNMGKN